MVWGATKDSPLWRKKAEKKRENSNIITSIENHESQAYFSLYQLKSPKASECAQNKESLKVWNSSCLNYSGRLDAIVMGKDPIIQ